jgi:Novel STAND NTPase 1
MLINPFTPTEIASGPDDFFGRSKELDALEQSLKIGSVAIEGPIGIGKSSLLAQVRLLMEGFNNSNHKSKTFIAVGDKDIRTSDEAARLLLEAFVQIDEKNSKISFKIGNMLTLEAGEVCKYFKEGRHLAALKRIIEKEYLTSVLADGEFLLLAIDEADKCPVPLARLIRAISTHTQQQGVKSLRFVICGVRPFLQKMIEEDQGVNRFFSRKILLEQMPEQEAADLVETKLRIVVEDAKKQGVSLNVDEGIVERVISLSGGHPHLLQLLGSHLIEHENENPDGLIDSTDLYQSLSRICYENRASIYEDTLHLLELEQKISPFIDLLDVAESGFPTRIERVVAVETVGKENLKWLVENNFLSRASSSEYGLVDEFLRIRVLLDQTDTESEEENLEQKIIKDEWEEDGEPGD